MQVMDNRGLAVRTLQYNRSAADTPADELITRQRYTARRGLSSQSQDADSVVQLFDVEGGPVWKIDSWIQRTDWSYDVSHRLVAMEGQ